MAAKRLAAVSHVTVARHLLLSDEVHADVRHTDRIQEIQRQERDLEQSMGRYCQF